MTAPDRNRAYQVLGIRPPFTERELKSAFRAAAMAAHPDRGGDDAAFRAVKQAFDLLQPDAGKDRVVDPIRRTVDGVLMDTLGKGLRVSARKCNACSGRGYQEQKQVLDCSCTDWTKVRSLHDFMATNIRRLNCRKCGGRGWTEGPSRCWVCTSCEGTGEIALFNPVFIKGAMTQKERKRNG